MSDGTTEVGIEKDEWWPVYSLFVAADSSRYATKCTLPDRLIKRATDAFEEFEAVQRELERFFEESSS